MILNSTKNPLLKDVIGTHDVVIITLDTLRYDVAETSLQRGLIPNMAARIPGGQWERRHTPASFTYAAHLAYFAGFLPTPVEPGKHPRLYASRFVGSETSTSDTFCFDEPDIVSALAARDYHTLCIGGVGFFNKLTALGSVLPNLFSESHWSPQLSVTDPCSTENQVDLAIRRVEQTRAKVFLFLNVSALHQPNYFYLPGATSDSMESQIAALAYVDMHLKRLWDYLAMRSPGFCILCSDHGTAYGEDGYCGHRVGHSVVWDVPYTHFVYAP